MSLPSVTRRSNTQYSASTLPTILSRLASDEYYAPPYTRRDLHALSLLEERSEGIARSLNCSLDHYYHSRCGTVASLAAINAAAGKSFYQVSRSAEFDGDEVQESLAGNGFVIDVQTHYVADHRTHLSGAKGVNGFIRQVAPQWFSQLNPAVDLSLSEFLRCVFLQSETRVAVLTSAPGTEDVNILSNAEIAGTRALIDRFAGSGRLLHHSIVHPNLPGELDQMAELVKRYRPNGFKVYTLFGDSHGDSENRGWMLDDERYGLPFIERARELGVNIICAHKGLSGLAPTGSPADIGPVAAKFPDMNFLVYHSGYEVPRPLSGSRKDNVLLSSEGAFNEAGSNEDGVQEGTDRLVESLQNAGIKPGSNVYAELGSTWYILIKRPDEATHVLGKLLLAVGEDNILWGTDSVWYGPTQPLIDAFRAFEIPEEYQQRFGYPALTPEVKNKILGLNAVRVYGIDRDQVMQQVADDDLSWVREAVEEYRQQGLPV